MSRKYNLRNKKKRLKDISDKYEILLDKYKLCNTDNTKKEVCDNIIANRLHFARTVNNQTLKYIAQRMGCKYQQIAKFINCENSLKVNQLILWSEKMDVSLKWILKGLNNKGGINDNKTN